MKVFMVLLLLSIASVAFCGFNTFGEWYQAKAFQNTEMQQDGELQITYNRTFVTNLFRRSVHLCVFQWIESRKHGKYSDTHFTIGWIAPMCMAYLEGNEFDEKCLGDSLDIIGACPNADHDPRNNKPTPDLGEFIQCVYDYIPTFMNCSIHSEA